MPAYRGIAYLVIEDLELGEFGNRVPQLSFEVIRAVEADSPQTLSDHVRAVALMPGSGILHWRPRRSLCAMSPGGTVFWLPMKCR